MSTDEYVPSGGEVRSAYVSRYLTDQRRRGAEFDRFLARVHRDAEAELDSWMTRAYEAEGKLWKAEAERDYRRRENEELAIALNLALTGEEVQTGERYSNAVALSQAVLRADRAEARIKAVEDVLDRWELAPDAHRPLRVTAKSIRRALESVTPPSA